MWTERPLAQVAEIISGGTPSRDNPQFWNGEIPWVTPTDITACRTNLLADTAERISALGLASSAATIVPAGSILLTSRASVGECRVAAMAVCTNQGFKSLVPRDIDGTFLYYQVQRIRSVFERYAAGSTFLEIGKRDTARVPIPHPIDCGLQRKIAAILTSLDTAIEKTEALIEKHQQIKAGLMHDLFTRGVLPNGQLRAMRDRASHHYMHTSSGWTPKEWAIRRLSEMAEIVSGVTVGNAAVRGPSCTVPYLRVANVQDGYLDLSEVKTIRVSSSMFDDLKLVSGDVLMNEGGDFDKLGRGTVWSGEIQDCIHQNHVFRVRTDAAQLDPWFLAFYSESSFGKRYFVLSSKQSTNLASINSTQLKAYPIVTPPIAEQRAIAARLRSANSKTDVFKREVAKLKAQKSGLMQSLLTGRTLVPIDTSGRSFADA